MVVLVVEMLKDMLQGNKKGHYKVEKNRMEAVRFALSKLRENDLLLILGKGHEEFIIVKDERIPFNDRKAVEQILKEEKMKIES